MVAQTPHLNGVRVADLSRSTIPGPHLKSYPERITGSGPTISENAISVGEHGEQRTHVAFRSDGQPVIAPVSGVPTRATAVMDGQRGCSHP